VPARREYSRRGTLDIRAEARRLPPGRFENVTAGLATLPDETVIDASQEFVIGGHVPSHLGVDSIVIGFYGDKKPRYAARVRAGFVPLTRRQGFERIKSLETGKCPFVNLPEKDAERWGSGIDGREDEGMSLGEASGCGRDRVSGMAWRWSFATYKVRRSPRRQRPPNDRETAMSM
jgi:hypothetical protein